MNKRILVIEDDESIREMITFALEIEGFKVQSVDCGEKGIIKFRDFKPNLILLDLMLPDINGFKVCKIIHEEKDIPIIMVTAKNDVVDKVLGLEIGADDYITKPFHVKEVIARVNKSLERVEKIQNKTLKEDKKENFIKIGEETYIDTAGRMVIKFNKEISFRPKEYDLLYLLAVNKGRVFSREQLLNKIWGYDYFGELRTVDVHIRRIRAKLEDDKNKYIETIFGIGYKLK
ncbi:response regulator transcription factor [Clostridium fallax]|uniref:Stage 0 sporulation protein A homolog n=1 Tax=Clostridium fallax TaxID=1533 RepID=A0A1M4SP08_9CLOT|nr:response regulator transcription factor [Clostridium fallax]SHE33918.1 DNA-binding response regulator, OmpR family, contains REC and winged-helix (wHTH) domain [Clostridium fallax]SQB07910.1 Two component transcriptional regulator, winged helix family [Clostridium fallax]